MTELAVGTHLHSAVGPVEVIVVRGPSQPLRVLHAGAPLLGPGEAAPEAPGAVEAAGAQTLLGKRYIHEASGLELLCVKPGPGCLSVDGEPLPVKTAKQLPASD
ncbi:hypothetical protein [Peterkaempfera bronchialis]|uniref:Uncharacterized protein n=1 Tax=Peterkaempfera bronchialis TaxID=2126346 RepID=A0A345SRD0_9ACTN|nr:hypothetical protein [Peterkaempfera bronchialis]AXI76285.1 hypothetical protein C7M71_001125 [Peterkaempfera bronchialis]